MSNDFMFSVRLFLALLLAMVTTTKFLHLEALPGPSVPESWATMSETCDKTVIYDTHIDELNVVIMDPTPSSPQDDASLVRAEQLEVRRTYGLNVHSSATPSPSSRVISTAERNILPTEQTTLPPAPLTELPHGAVKFGDCDITYYCCEKREHICGTGDGITASGRPVTADLSVAVDTDYIPLGSQVFVDFGDGEGWHVYRADDVGGAIHDHHIDIAKTTHAEALSQTKVSGLVYYIPPLK